MKKVIAVLGLLAVFAPTVLFAQAKVAAQKETPQMLAKEAKLKRELLISYKNDPKVIAAKKRASQIRLAKVTLHSATITWALASPPSTLTGFNIYSAPCTGTFTAAAGQPTNAPASGSCSAAGTFMKIGTVGSSILTYTDATITAGLALVYQVTSQCPATGACIGESAPSNQVAGFVPGSAPAAPTISLSVQ